MIAISTLVIISFVWFYSDRGSTRRGRYGGPGSPTDKVAKIYDRSLTRAEVDRAQREFITAYQLGLPNFVRPEFSGDQANFLWNLFVVQHEARKAGIQPTEAEVEDAIRKIPLFQADGGRGFDPAKYAKFLDERLNPRGLGAKELEELVRTDLQLGRLHQLIDATVVVRPSELRAQYDNAYSKIEAAVIRLKASDLAAGIEVKDDEVTKYYEEQKEHLNDPERRRVQYVVFSLTEEQKKLPSRERVEAAQKLADKVSEFSQKMLEPKADFAKTAADYGLAVKETPEFSQTAAATQLKDAGLPPTLLPEFAASAFRLRPQDPNSDALPNADNPDAFYLLHLLATVPARPLSLDEARPKIIQDLKTFRARANLTAQAEEIRGKLLAALAAKKPIADAAKEVGQTAQDLPAFSLDDAMRDAPTTHFADSELVTETAETLNAGELSKFLPNPDGGLFVFVKNRLSPDAARFDAQQAMFMTQYRLSKERTAFVEWLRVSREAAGLKIFGRGARDEEG